MSCLNRRRRYIQRREFRLHTLQDLRVGCRLDLLRRCPRTVVTQGVLTADARYGVARSKGFTFRSVRMRNGREDFIALVASIFDWFGGVTRWCVTWISVGIFLFPRWISGTIGAANVLTPGAYLGSIREESRTFMASASNSLLWLLKHQGLPTGLGIRPGQGNLLPQSVVGIRLDRPWNHGGIGFLLLALASWLPRGVSGARLASDVLAFRTHFVASIRRAAQVAGSVDAHADWLLDPVDVLLWSSR